MNHGVPTGTTESDVSGSSPAGAVRSAVTQIDGGRLDRPIEVGSVAPEGGAVRGVVVWCHGLGGSHVNGAALAAVWAARGYCVVLPTFADSIRLVAARHRELRLDPADPAVEEWALDADVGAFMVRSMLDWPWREDRLAVLGRVLDTIPTIVADATGHGATTADSAAVAVGGHSFGAYVAQLAAGAVIDCPLGDGVSFRDERVSAVVCASGQGRGQAGLRDGSWDHVEIPLLNITGTRDRGATSDDPAWKREPFTLSPPGGKHQVVIAGADHGLGGVSGDSARFPPNSSHWRIVARMSSVFWDAYLGDDDEARRWLVSDGPATQLGADAEYGYR